MARLIDEGATIPFISRYRKEQTSSLDEVAVASVKEELAKFEELEKRKQTVLTTIEEQGKAVSKISALVDTYKIDAIAIGNGTASRETENLIKHTRFNREVRVFVVSEDGA